MGARLLAAFAAFLFLALPVSQANAIGGKGPALPEWNNANWWRGCASLDMDFYNDRYYINNNTTCDGTTGTQYSGIANFITGTGATFTRAGTTNITDTNPPFYIDTTQGEAFVSRASSAYNITTFSAPFYASSGGGQTFVSRSTSATYFDSTGTLQTKIAGSGVTGARSASYYYNGSSWVLGGLLLEPPATNSIRQNTMTGGSAPSTLPYDWGNIGNLNGLSVSYAYGTENGLNYVDVTLSGTATANGAYGVVFDYSPTASLGMFETLSYYAKLSGGTNTNVTGVNLRIDEHASGGGYVAGGSTTFSTIPSTALGTSQFTFHYTVSGSSTTTLYPYTTINYNAGAVNITLRIGMPQLEQNPYATSVIATSGSAVTRAADVYAQETSSYFDSAGTLQYASANTARTNYVYSGGSWVGGGTLNTPATTNTLIEPAATNYVVNSIGYGAQATDGLQYMANSTFVSCTNGSSSCVGWTVGTLSGSASATFNTGSVTLTGDGTNAASVYQAVQTISGQIYSVTVSATSFPPSGASSSVGNTIGGSNLAAITNMSYSVLYYFTATSATSYVQISNLSSSSFVVNSVSVQHQALPTGWNTPGYGSAGLNWAINGTGIEFGMNYVDYRISGTSTSYTFAGINPAYTTVSPGQVWSSFFYARLVAGTTTGSVRLADTIANTTGTNCVGSGAAVTPTSTLTLYSVTGCIVNTGITTSRPQVTAYFSTGIALDFTIRVYAIQFENYNFTTSFIPTVSATETRNADVYSVPSGGTYFNSSGVLEQAPANTPRLDHNPISPFSPAGLLIEESRTNSIANSIPDSGTNWTYTNATGTINSAASPDGNTYATTFTDNSTSGVHDLVPAAGLSLTSGTTYTYSIFAKAGTAQYLEIAFANPPFSSLLSSAYQETVVNLSTCAATQGLTSAATTQAMANGWCRISVYDAANTTTTGTPILALTNNTTSGVNSSALPSYSGSGEYVYLWGAQFEAGLNSTSYIPTSGAAVTRATDAFTVPGTAAGGWLTAGVGTFGTEGAINLASGNSQAFAALDNGSTSQSLSTQVGNGGNRAGVFYVAGQTYLGKVTGYTFGALTKMCLTYTSTPSAYENGAADGTAFNTNGTYAIPTTSRLTVGHARGTTVADLDGWVRRIWYMPTEQADASLLDYTR